MECWSSGNSFVALLHHSTTPSLHWLKMHQAEIIVLLFAAVAALGTLLGGTGGSVDLNAVDIGAA